MLNLMKINKMNVVHLADIHIRNNQRHEEYRNVLTETLFQLGLINVDYVFLCGDIFHQKTTLSPEAITIAKNFIRQLSFLVKKQVVIIPGNHDINLSDLSRLDSISPIVEDIDKVMYYNKGGIYDLDENIRLFIHSQLDTPKNTRINKKYEDNKINMCLFHGPINGSSNYNNFSFDSDYTVDYFEKFDYTFLGDIHKLQFFGKNKQIAYSGSLICQNFGEHPTEHGFILWEIESKTKHTTKFITINNECFFITCTLDEINKHDLSLPKRCNVRIILPSNLQSSDYKQIKEDISQYYPDINLFLIESKKDIIENRTIQESQLNFYDINTQQNQITNYLTKEDVISVQEVLKLNEETNQKLKIKEYQLRDKKVDIKTLKIKNLFIFGEEQEIDFSDLNGIIGLYGKNGYGKSSVVDVFLWTIYGKISRSSVKSQILNKNNNKNGYGILEFNIDGQFYRIKRDLNRQGTSKVAFEKLILNEWQLTNDNLDNKKDTDKLITKYFGSYDDAICTYVSSQDSISKIIEDKRIKKDVISRFIGLDLFEECWNIAKQSSLVIESEIKSLNKERNEELIVTLNITKNKYVEELMILNATIEQLKMESEKNQSIIEEMKTQLLIIPNIISDKNDLDLQLKKQETIKEDNIKKQEVLLINIKQCNIDILNIDERLSKFTTLDSNIFSLKRKELVDILISIEDKYKLEIIANDSTIDLENENNVSTIESELQKQAAIRNNLNDQYNVLCIQHKEQLIKIESTRKLSSLIDNAYCNGEGEYATCSFIKESIIATKTLNTLNEELLKISTTLDVILRDKTELSSFVNVKEAELETIKLKISQEKESFRFNSAYKKKQELIKIQDAIQKLDNLVEQINKDVKDKQEKQIKKLQFSNELDKLTNSNKQLDQEIQTLNDKIQIIKKYEKDIIHNEHLQYQIDTAFKILKDQKNDIIKSSNKINETQSQIDIITGQLQVYNQTIVKLQQREQIAKIYKLYLDCYSEDGIPHIILQKIIPYIENQTNAILNDICEFNIKLDVDINKDINIFKIINRENNIPIDYCSGMEKFCVSIALRIVYTQINSLSKFDLFIIDEGFGVLDKDNIQNVQFIFEYLKQRFTKILVISHLTDIKEFYDNQIEILKNENKDSIICLN